MVRASLKCLSESFKFTVPLPSGWRSNEKDDEFVQARVKELLEDN